MLWSATSECRQKEWLTECYDRWPRPTDGLKRGFTCAVSTHTSGTGACGTASRGLLPCCKTHLDIGKQ